MPAYHLHLENSALPNGDVTSQEFESDDLAAKEAAIAVAEVLKGELAAGRVDPHATVTVKREDATIAIIKASASIERFD